MKFNRRLLTGFVLLAALIVACSCPVSLAGLNPMNGIEETGKALASQLPQGMAETAEALATRVDISPEEIARTAQAVVTDVSPQEILQTAEAGVGTLVPGTTGEPPADIPVPGGDVSMQVSSPEMLSYTVKQSAEEVKAFYEAQMPAYGWTAVENDGFQVPGATALKFKKEAKTASVTIVGIGETTQVLINILGT